MNETEIAYLRNEVGRLNQIINVLLKQNYALETENSYLKNNNGIQNNTSSNENIMDGITNVNYADPKITDGKTNNSYSNAKNNNGITESFFSAHKIDNGITNTTSSDPKNKDGISKDSQTAPINIPLEEANIWKLAYKLREVGFNTVSRSGIKNAATLLLHFYNKSSGDYPTLRKVTGLSEGGLGKTIMSLKKRGVIHRSAYRQFSLSDSMQQMIGGMFAQ